jgi:hypothetical protein
MVSPLLESLLNDNDENNRRIPLMPRFIARWTVAAAAAGLMTLPAAALAQSTGSSQPPSQPPASQSATASSADQSATPADHVREAKQALDNIPKSSIPSADRAKFAQLRTHLNKLEKDVAAESPSAKPRAKSGAPQWATEMAAIDKLVTELAGPESSSTPGATGTTGTASSAPAAKPGQLDEQARTGLNQVRQHITALAAEMSGTASPAPSAQNQATGSSAASNPDAMGTRPSSASQSASSNPAQSSSTQSAASGSQTTTPPAPTGTQSSVTQPPASSSQTPASASQTPASTSTPLGDQPAAGQANEAAAKQHLTEARDSLAALTKMPEASKLQGDARSNVSQLISDFNELITTQLNWRDSDQKVEADVTKLLGSENGDANPAAPSAPAAAAGTMGSASGTATGTTGSATPPPAAAGQQPSGAAANAQLDPAIRAKLVEFRSHLKDFEQAAGGSSASSTSPAAPSSAPAAASAASSAMNPAVSTGSTSNPANPAASSATSSAAGTAGATGTTGAAAPQPTGTTGTTPAPASAASEASATTNSLANRTEIQRHLDAIQSLLTQAKDGKLDKAQTDQLKSEVEQLRQLLGQSK